MYIQQCIRFLIIALLTKKYSINYTQLQQLKQMSQKSKSIKKIEEEQPSIEEEIAEIHQKKQLFGKIFYLVQFKGSDPKKQWKPEAQLQKNPTFHKEYIRFQITLKIKNKLSNPVNTQSPQPKQSRQISVQKQTKNSQTLTVQPKKIHIDKQKIKVSATAIKQQMSLDSFVGKSKGKMEEEQKNEPTKVEQSKNIRQSRPNIKVETSMIGNKQKQELLRQQMKTLNINEGPKQKVKVNPIWLQKIKSIGRIKGYELKNGQMFYDVEASDRNGQNFFIPPLPSQIVSKFDTVKLAGFLQDCLLRGYAEQNNSK